MGKIVGIIALKGGVGKTTSTVALAGTLGKDLSKKVLVIDANYTAPNLGLHLGYVKPELTIHDVLQGKVKAGDAIYTTEHGFDIIAGSLISKDVHSSRLKEKIVYLKANYDIILLDSSPTLNDEILSVMIAADELLCVTTPDYPTLSCTIKAVKHAKLRHTNIIGLILNKVRNKDFELSLQEIEESANCNVLAVIPDEEIVLKALSKTIPSTILFNNADSSVEYRMLAAALLGENYEDTRIKSRLQRLFRLKLQKQEVNRSLLKENSKKILPVP